MLRHRKNVHDDIHEADLKAIDASILAFHSKFKETIAPLMASEGETIKYHRLSHVTHSIRLHGHLRETHAQFYEGSNKEEKIAYRGTSGRMTDDEHLEGMVVNQQMRRVLRQKSTFDQDSTVVARKSAYLVAASEGKNTMNASELFVLSTRFDPPLEGDRGTFITELGDFPHIRDAIKRYYQLPSKNDKRMPTIKPRATAVLSAVVPWLPEDSAELQTVRATPQFYGRPYFDVVQFQFQSDQVEYGHLRLIFLAVCPVTGKKQELVCVKVLSPTGNEDVLTKYGSTHLEYDDSPDAYQVLPLSTLVRRVYIVEDFATSTSEKKFFHTCVFKWTRTPIEN